MRRRRPTSPKKLTVYAAIAANIAIAAAKLIAAGVSGSSALLSEGLHSLIDTGDGLLLLLGLALATRPPTERHPYGRGAEVYFWSMVVAMCVFGLGGGVSIFQGIEHLRHPVAPTHAIASYAVLGVAALFEGTSWIISLRGFREERAEGDGIWEGIRRSKDPTTFVVVLEDGAALIGIAFAATGLTLTLVFHNPAFDAIASLAIGALLLGVGIILGRETWSLLLGEAATRETVDSIYEIASVDQGIRHVEHPRSMHLGPDLVHVDLDVALYDPADAVAVTRRVEAAIHARHPEIKRVSFRFPADDHEPRDAA